MARFELECLKCGAKLVTRDVSELAAWDKEHGSVCVARDGGDDE